MHDAMIVVFIVRVCKRLIVNLSKHYNCQYRYQSIGIDVNIVIYATFIASIDVEYQQYS